MIRAKDDATRSLNSVSSSMRRASSQAQAAGARANAAALRAAAQQGRVNGMTNQQVAALRQNATAWENHAREIERDNSRMQEMGQTISGVGQLMTTAGLGIAAAGAVGVVALGKTVGAAEEWDRQVRLTWTQVDKKYKPSLQALGDIGIDVAKKVAVPFDQIQTALFDIFSSMDVSLPQAQSLMMSFSKAAVAGQTDVQTASRATIGLMNTFDVPIKDVNKVLNSQFELVKEGVGTYEEWAKTLGNVSPSARRAGQSMDTMMAALATATRQGMTAARASTSVARAFDAMSNPKTEKNLQALGIATRDAKGQFLPMVDVLGKWKAQLDKLPEKDKVKEILDVMKGAGGTIEARRFLQNILLTKGGLGLFQTELKAFSTDKDAFKRGYNEMAGSVASQTTLLNNGWQTLKVTVGHALTPVLLDLVKKGQKLIDWFNNLPAPVKELIAKLALLASVLLIISGAATIIVGALLALAGAIAAAGTAILPVLAGMTLLGGAFVAIGGAIAGFVALMVLAWQKSSNFRGMLHDIWNDVKTDAGVFVDAGKKIWSAAQAQIVPALKNVWTVIDQQYIPAIRDAIKWMQDHLLPVFQAIAAYAEARIIPAFNQIKDVINNDVVPALKLMVAWWNQNKSTLVPLINMFLMFVKILGGVVVDVIVGLITWIAIIIKVLSGLSYYVQTLANDFKNLVTAGINLVIDTLTRLYNTIKDVIKWFKSLGDGAESSWKKVPSVFRNGIGTIKGMFSNSGSMLFGAGQNIGQGLANGVNSKLAAVRAAGTAIGNAVAAATRASLDEHSPSKVFKDIGANIVRGLTLGVSTGGTQKQLSTALFNLSRSVINSIDAAKVSKSLSKKQKKAMTSKWQTRLSSTTKKLNSLESKRTALQTKLAAAQKSVNDQIKVRNDLASSITDSLSKQTDLTTLDVKSQKSATSMAAGLNTRLQALKTFQANLLNLSKRGLDKQTIADLASQGVDTAGAIVQTLVNGSNGDLQQISKIQGQIRSIASQTGTSVAGSLYNAGIQAAQGLAKGLQSQIANITKQMTSIANALVKQIKKELGIHSPSKVMHAIGVNTAKGYVNGYTQHMNKKLGTMTGGLIPSRLGGTSSVGYMGSSVNKVYNQNINVHTQEIDPRKTSAQLGWELMGKVG
jgi:TP901 family phage tail tape measure protein